MRLYTTPSTCGLEPKIVQTVYLASAKVYVRINGTHINATHIKSRKGVRNVVGENSVDSDEATTPADGEAIVGGDQCLTYGTLSLLPVAFLNICGYNLMN